MNSETIRSIALRLASITFCMCGFAATLSASGVQAAPAGQAYTVVEMGPHAAQIPSYSVGINARGDVVGMIGNETQVPFLYRNGRFTRLTPPGSVSQALATGINDSDVISVQAIDKNGDSVAFAVKPNGSGFAWIPLPTGSLPYNNIYVSNVDAKGDIDGGMTVTLPNGDLEQRSALWRVKPNGAYQDAQLLPMSSGFVATIAGGIWYRHGTPYVAGAQGDGGTFQDASLWSPTATLTHVPFQMPFASTIGGTSQHVYAAGTTRSSTFSAWVSEVTFDRAGVARLQSVDILPMCGGYDQAVGSGVTVDAQGRFIVVGDVASTTSMETKGVIWRGNAAPTLLQTLTGQSPWSINDAAGVNHDGDIAAAGTAGPTDHALLLRPRR